MRKLLAFSIGDPTSVKRLHDLVQNADTGIGACGFFHVNRRLLVKVNTNLRYGIFEVIFMNNFLVVECTNHHVRCRLGPVQGYGGGVCETSEPASISAISKANNETIILISMVDVVGSSILRFAQILRTN